jgi:malyl-CoA/(S)-citramalyl-CoA lyase
MLDGKMEDDASVKQCRVMIDLAEQIAARDSEIASLYANLESEPS